MPCHDLVLVPYLAGWEFPAEQIFPFDVLVQMGTLVAVIIYFWKDLWNVARAWISGLAQRRPFESADSRLGWYLILATIPNRPMCPAYFPLLPGTPMPWLPPPILSRQVWA